MNRRRFLAGLGAAVAAVAVATRLGETKLALAAGDGVPLNSGAHPYLANPDTGWFLREEDAIGIPRLSEESLEQMCIDLLPVAARIGKPIRVMPTHVIYGRP